MALTRAALADRPRAGAHHLALPGHFPADRYDAIVIAELLYYLDDATLRAVAAEIVRTLRPGGRLVLCHHHRAFHDASQRQEGLHRRFVAGLAGRWRITRTERTNRWELTAIRRAAAASIRASFDGPVGAAGPVARGMGVSDPSGTRRSRAATGWRARSRSG